MKSKVLGAGPPDPLPDDDEAGMLLRVRAAQCCALIYAGLSPLIYGLKQIIATLIIISKPQTTTATRVFGAGEASSGTNGTRSSGARAGVLIPTPVLAGMAGTVPPDPEPPVI